MVAVAATYRIARLLVPLAAALLAASAARMQAQAQTPHMLVIPASDGYGFDDCIGSNKACGQVVADAWCEAHGMAPSLSFGRAEDITASIAASAKTSARTSSKNGPPGKGDDAMPAMKFAPGSFIVNCRG